MPGFDDLFHSELLPERLPFVVAGLPQTLKLRKLEKPVAVLPDAAVGDAAQPEGACAFVRLLWKGNRARVTADHAMKDLTIRVELRKGAWRWSAVSSRMEQR